ncbi:MAG: glycosyltransferase family 2 protein [Armatimonadota bacterium]
MISLVIPSMNKLYYTRRCLESLLLTAGEEFELIVVDNGSTDGTAEYLLTYRAQATDRGIPVTMLLNDRNVGACTARNQAIGLCRGSEVAFLDNDIVLRDRRWLTGLRETLYSDERIAAVIPKLLFPFPPYAIEHAGIAISPSGKVGYLGRGADREAPEFNTRRELQGAASACLLVKRSVLDEVGGFDEVYNPVQFEDLDLLYRMRARGYTVVYEPAVEMYHFENVTTDNSPALNFKYQTIKNGLEFKRRWRDMFAAEDGPADERLRWEELPRRRIEEIGELEVRE